MTEKKNKKITPKMIYPAVSVALFALCFLYLWLIVDPKLIFHGGGKITNYPVFFKGLDFFLPFSSAPGGPAEYLAALLSQALFYSWLGAAILTVLAAGICFSLRFVIKSCEPKTIGVFWLLPMVLLTVIYSRYYFNFVTTVALAISLIFICLYLKIKTKSKAGRFIIFAALSIILYMIAGGVFLLFSASAILYDLFFRKNKSFTIGQLILSIFIPYAIGFFLAGQTMIDAYTSLLPFSWKIIVHEDARATAWLMYVIYMTAPVAIIALGIAKLKPTFVPIKLIATFTNSKSWVVNLILLLMAAAAIGISFDKKNKLLYQCDYYSYYQQWDKVINVAEKNLNSLFLGSAATRALYHQNELFDKMFEFYQYPTVLFMETKGQSKLFWKQADIYFDLGYINMAEHKWTNCLDAFGERPMILKRLAWINLVKDNPDAARIYLNSIKRTFFYNDFADKYLSLLKNDPEFITDAKIQLCRKKMIKKDYSKDFTVPEIAISNLLQSCSENKMAYEYMMTWFLLTKQLDKLTQNANYMKFYDYSKLPICFADAFLIYKSKTGIKTDLSKPLNITLQDQQRFADFGRLCAAYKANETLLFNQLKGRYGNSYLFYFLFNRSGMKDDKVD